MKRQSIAALGLGLTLALAAGGVQAQDKKNVDSASKSFIKSAIEGNLAEVDVGKLAQEKGQSAEVKKFGQMLVSDHGKANEQARTAAKSVDVDPPTGSSLMEKGTYAKLKVLSGDSFDKSFIDSMVSDHQSDIKDYQKESAKSDPVGQYAKESLPTLQKHLKEAQRIQAELKQKSTTGSKQ